MKYEDNEFDALLKDSLMDLREAEPRAGLEGRVLANIGTAGRERSFGWWSWAATAVMVILIVLGIAVRRGAKNDVVVNKATEQAIESEPVNPSQPGAEKSQESSAPTASRALPAREERPISRPKHQQNASARSAPMPAPTPLNEQEEALLILARNHPEVFVSMERERNLTKQEIAPINIDPIKVEGRQEEEK
jgi:hypothetical protein